MVIIGIPSRIELVLVYLVSIEMVLVSLVSIELAVCILLVKFVSGILEWVFLVYYIHIFTLVLRILYP